MLDKKEVLYAGRVEPGVRGERQVGSAASRIRNAAFQAPPVTDWPVTHQADT